MHIELVFVFSVRHILADHSRWGGRSAVERHSPVPAAGVQPCSAVHVLWGHEEEGGERWTEGEPHYSPHRRVYSYRLSENVVFLLLTDFITPDLSHRCHRQGYCNDSHLSATDRPSHSEGKHAGCLFLLASDLVHILSIYKMLLIPVSPFSLLQFGQHKSQEKGGLLGSMHNVVNLLMERIK